jgi:four helix bundle protein
MLALGSVAMQLWITCPGVKCRPVRPARFLDIAKGSSGEVRSMYYAAEDIGYVSAEVARQRREKAVKISKGIATLSSHFRT